MIEVGYKFRFFGEDAKVSAILTARSVERDSLMAKVAAKVLGVIAFMSRNLLTASISNSNTWFHIHLKKYVKILALHRHI